MIESLYTLGRKAVRRLRRVMASPRPPTSPAAVYSRWRTLQARGIDARHFSDHGLDDVWARYPGKLDRQIIVLQALRNAVGSGARGAVVEFGCFNGHTAIQMVKTLESLGDTSRVVLFDSFEGMPVSVHPEDRYWSPGTLKADFAAVSNRFASYPNVEIVKGFFADVLPGYPDTPVKFAHVDVDLYSSVREVDDWLLDRVSVGGVVVYDDYGFESCAGLMKAVDEDLKDRSDYHTYYLPTGQYIATRLSSGEATDPGTA
jgi:hypothetical protein